MESCSFVVLQILEELLSREGDIGIETELCKIIQLKGLPKFAQTFTVGFLKLLSTHPTHSVLLRCTHMLVPSL